MLLFAILSLLTAFFIYEARLSKHQPKQAKISVYKAEQIDNFLCFLDKLKTQKIAPNKKPPIMGGLP